MTFLQIREKKSNLSLDVNHDYYYDGKFDQTNTDLDISSNSANNINSEDINNNICIDIINYRYKTTRSVVI